MTQADMHATDWRGTEEGMRAFVAQFDNPAFRARVIERSGADAQAINTRLDTYFSEMIFGYRFAAEHMPPGRLRILEVGAGLGLISSYLASLGHEVVALEPANQAFGIFEATKQEIWERLGDAAPVLVERSAEDIVEAETGTFDFIFSVNVMEHIADIEAATAAILAVLRPGGVCANSCPNYWVPYEPHYGIPMVPFLHGLTRRLFAGRIDPDPDTWETLNWINVGRVRRMAAANGATVRFAPSLIYRTFQRLGQDAEFTKRHQHTIVGRTYRFLRASGLLALTRFIPVWLATPMVFTYRKG